jgi:hypothetical protein
MLYVAFAVMAAMVVVVFVGPNVREWGRAAPLRREMRTQPGAGPALPPHTA